MNINFEDSTCAARCLPETSLLFSTKPPGQVLELLDSIDDLFNGSDSDADTAAPCAAATQPGHPSIVVERSQLMAMRPPQKRNVSMKRDADNPFFGLECRSVARKRRERPAKSRLGRADFGSAGSACSMASSMASVPEDSAVCDFAQFSVPDFSVPAQADTDSWLPSASHSVPQQPPRSHTDSLLQLADQQNGWLALQQPVQEKTRQLPGHEAASPQLSSTSRGGHGQTSFESPQFSAQTQSAQAQSPQSNVVQREQLQQLQLLLKRQQLERLQQLEAVKSQPRSLTAPTGQRQVTDEPTESCSVRKKPVPKSSNDISSMASGDSGEEGAARLRDLAKLLQQPSSQPQASSKAGQQARIVSPGLQGRSVTDLSIERRYSEKVSETAPSSLLSLPPRSATMPEKAERTETQSSSVSRMSTMSVVSVAPSTVRRKSMLEIVAEVETPPSSDDEFEAESALSPDWLELEIVVGPTQFAVMPRKFEDFWIEDKSGHKESINSHAVTLSVRDILRLTAARDDPQPLSFGSLPHVCGFEKCRPCMFERTAGRCKKIWLCDFCHLHSGRKGKTA
eukprot:gb/GFBE01043765.1/.p1 GENE.gb/GFBE01043765.1/~~gb/GFBE01043765.1/.p1  ORF type:complete len:567 (+),score=79.99 gb/GFBE01043765.1/:1-1701(+)